MAEIKGIGSFDYTAAAELFPTGSRKGNRRMGYRRFAKAADAIRFAIEELSPELLIGAHLEVNEERFNCDGIRRLYEHAEYRWCDVLPFDERPDPAMMDSARDEASAATGGQHGGFEAARGPCR